MGDVVDDAVCHCGMLVRDHTEATGHAAVDALEDLPIIQATLLAPAVANTIATLRQHLASSRARVDQLQAEVARLQALVITTRVAR